MPKAIVTQYRTTAQGKGYITASDEDGNRVRVAYEHGLNAAENHARAASAFLEKFSWSGEWVGGSLNNGYVFVCRETRGGLRIIR
jgi:hypothetical protein